MLLLVPAAAYVQRPRGAVAMTVARTRRSISLPFVDSPGYLDGYLVGDVGFDPLGFADETNLARMREAEVRHGRLAMVATWGWPVAFLGLRIAQALVPPASVCTGTGCAVDATTTGLTLPTIALIGETYWAAMLLAAVVGELRARRLPAGVPAFDPLNLASRRRSEQPSNPRLSPSCSPLTPQLRTPPVTMRPLASPWRNSSTDGSPWPQAVERAAHVCAPAVGRDVRKLAPPRWQGGWHLYRVLPPGRADVRFRALMGDPVSCNHRILCRAVLLGSAHSNVLNVASPSVTAKADGAASATEQRQASLALLTGAVHPDWSKLQIAGGARKMGLQAFEVRVSVFRVMNRRFRRFGIPDVEHDVRYGGRRRQRFPATSAAVAAFHPQGWSSPDLFPGRCPANSSWPSSSCGACRRCPSHHRGAASGAPLARSSGGPRAGCRHRPSRRMRSRT
eukprot:scaffold98053_cov69-Phaeocystis_antarctica.AAC.3